MVLLLIFLKFFWLQLGSFVVRSLNDGFRTGELSTTQKEGVPKWDKSKDVIMKGYRKEIKKTHQKLEAKLTS